jgi:hypothetical protein
MSACIRQSSFDLLVFQRQTGRSIVQGQGSSFGVPEQRAIGSGAPLSPS